MTKLLKFLLAIAISTLQIVEAKPPRPLCNNWLFQCCCILPAIFAAQIPQSTPANCTDLPDGIANAALVGEWVTEVLPTIPHGAATHKLEEVITAAEDIFHNYVLANLFKSLRPIASAHDNIICQAGLAQQHNPHKRKMA